MGDTAVEVTLRIRAEHAEGPLWDAATARLCWVDITGQRVHCLDPVSGNDSSWATCGQPGGLVLETAGEPVVASPEGLAVLDRSTGTMDLRVPVEQDLAENRANDVKTDSTGRAWVSTMAYDKRPRNAALYRVDGAKVTCVAERLTICNGPASDEPQGVCTWPTPPCSSSRCSIWPRRRARCPAAGLSSTSARRRSGRTA
jgi:sugar lactone lactonase YvrE